MSRKKKPKGRGRGFKPKKEGPEVFIPREKIEKPGEEMAGSFVVVMGGRAMRCRAGGPPVAPLKRIPDGEYGG